MYDNLLPSIRNAARALIIRGGQVLLLRKEGGGRGPRFSLPGGAQDPGETLEAALQRECSEEIGTRVTIRDLIFVADFFKERATEPPTVRHLVEFIFRCTVPDDYVAINGYKPDRHQTDVLWVELGTLSQLSFQPPSIGTFLAGFQEDEERVYLGLIN